MRPAKLPITFCVRFLLILPHEMLIQAIFSVRTIGATQLLRFPFEALLFLCFFPAQKSTFQTNRLCPQHGFKLFRFCLIQFSQLWQKLLLKGLKLQRTERVLFPNRS